MDIKTIVDLANIVVAGGVIFAITQININRKQLHLSTIERCINEFRELGIAKDTTDEMKIKRYVDLVNEELFYFHHEYLPKVIAYEWLDGMLDYIPLVDSQGKILNQANCITNLAKDREEYLTNYPRLKWTFTVKQEFRANFIYAGKKEELEIRSATRKAIVEELYQNIMSFVF